MNGIPGIPDSKGIVFPGVVVQYFVLASRYPWEVVSLQLHTHLQPFYPSLDIRKI
jgi:hypothetical protein